MSSVSAVAKSPAAPQLDFERCAEAVAAAERLLHLAKSGVRKAVDANGSLDASQAAAHGLAWVATYVEALRQMLGWAKRLEAEQRLTEMERLITTAAFGEYLAQLAGGIPMSQVETVRLSALGVPRSEIRRFEEQVGDLIDAGTDDGLKARLAEMIAAQPAVTTFGDTGLDETLTEMRTQMRRFAEAEVLPHAHEWHLQNEYIPYETITKLGELGVFGLTLPEAFGGLGLGKEAMCLVSEELSRGYIGVGSLGHALRDRRRADPGRRHRGAEAEVSAEDRLGRAAAHGRVHRAQHRLRPRLPQDARRARGRRLQGHGPEDLDHPPRARRPDDAAGAHQSAEPGYKGLSMLLAEKPRGSDADPFPAKGMTGGEIEVLGYRGMKEFDISFDGFEVPAAQLLGGVEGQGFKQLMTTFEAARIQTAARAIGVAQSAMDLALKYALDRKQFGKAIYAFPRVANKIVMMAVETMVARQLTYFAAREKDQGRRCDLEAGMAKLLGARIAWANADNALQIHGGNGFALEYPVSRLLCDARILNIFEGAAEIQAHVISRRLLEGAN